jgi:hypothetical protein
MASIDVEAAACSASSVDLRIGCSGRNWKFRLDMHSISVGYRVTAPQDETHGSLRERPTGNQEKNSQTARHAGRGFPRALRRTAYATAMITFASHEASAPILTPVIPAMIAAATKALIATQTPQRRSALR